MKKLKLLSIFIMTFCLSIIFCGEANAANLPQIKFVNRNQELVEFEYDDLIPISTNHRITLESGSNMGEFEFYSKENGCVPKTINGSSGRHPDGSQAYYYYYILPHGAQGAGDDRDSFSTRFTGNEVFTVRYHNIATYGSEMVDCLVTIRPHNAGPDNYVDFWLTDYEGINYTNYGGVGFNENFYKGFTYLNTGGATISYNLVKAGTNQNLGLKKMYWSWGSINKPEGIASLNTVKEYYLVNNMDYTHTRFTNFTDDGVGGIEKARQAYAKYRGASSGNLVWGVGLDAQHCSDTWGVDDFDRTFIGFYVESSNGIYSFETLSHDFWFCPFFYPMGATAPKPTKQVKNATSDWTNSVKAYVGDRIQFKVDQRVQNRQQGGTGYLKYDSFSYEDQLPREVEYNSARVIRNTDGADVTNQGSLNYDPVSHKVTFTFSYNFLNEDWGMKYVGETYSLIIDCTVDSDSVEGQAFNNYPKTIINRKTLTNTTPATVTPYYKKAKISVSKEDAETGKTTQGDATLAGAEYSIYLDSGCTNFLEKIVLDENGNQTSSTFNVVEYRNGQYTYKENYYIKETKAPEGYNIDNNVYHVFVDRNSYPDINTVTNVEQMIKNISITSKDLVIRNDIEIIKNLGETSNTPQFPLDKCEFTATLISSIGTDHVFSVKCTAETDENGYCIIENLPYGRYIVEETKVSPISLKCADFRVFVQQDRTVKTDPYVPKDGKFDATTLGEEIGTTKDYDTTYNWLDIDGHIVDVPKVMQIKIRKVDEYATEEDHQYTQGDAVIKGAIYQIYRYDPRTDDYTEYVYDITVDHIDEDGYWCSESQDLLVGKYMVKEKIKQSVKEADGKTYNYSYAEGYLVDEEEYYFEQKPDEQQVRVTYQSAISTERVVRGRIDAIKYNDNSTSTDKNPAVGAKLRLSLDKNPEVYYDAVVDETGYIEWVEEKSRAEYYPYTIPYGVYTISEVESSNSGENIFIYKQKTEIKHSTNTKHYIFNDEYVKLKPYIRKIDAETKKVIPGESRFKIWNVNKQEWYSEMIYPSGKVISEFSTNEEGYFTINRHLEAGSYVIYETQAPYGYYLDDKLRVDNRGYEFTIGVERDGQVVVWHDNQKEVATCETQIYDNIPTRIYSWTAYVEDPPQKAVIRITDLAEQFTKVDPKDSDYGTVNTPVFEEAGLKDVEFDIIAKEDVYTPEGTKRYSKGDIVAHLKTDENGKDESVEIYLGDYEVVQTKVPNGYTFEDSVDLHIEYTHQYERVQYIDLEFRQKLQKTNLTFEKVFKELEYCKFAFDNKSATFGIYSKEVIKNYRDNNTIGADELVDIIKTDDNYQVKNNVQLPEGEYYVKELEVTSPFKKVQDVFEFAIEYKDNNDSPIEVTINNGKVENEAETVELELLVYPEPDYEENEIDGINTRDELENLAKKFGIPNKRYGIFLDEECKKPVMTTEGKPAEFKTNENGIIHIPDMPTGTYYFKELEAPAGYELSEEVIKAVVTGNQKIVLCKAKEPMIEVSPLYKYDTFTKDGIVGIKFEITDEEDNFICYAETEENGVLNIPALYFKNGEKYYYKEVSESGLYQVDEEKHEFIAEYDENFEWTVDIIPVGNDRKTIDFVKIIKKDSKTSELLEGCVFTIVLLDENGEEYVNANGEKIYLVENAVTNENGEYVIENVPYGTYKFVEMVAPEGYEIDEDMTGLTFIANDETKDGIIFEVTNTGDIAVIALSVILIVSVIGIAAIVLKNKRFNKNI